MTLMPFQDIGSEWLSERSGAILADEPGLGKTVQAIRACDLVFASRVLIVCPASVVPNWRIEIERWRLGGWTALVLSYEGMAGKYRDQVLGEDWCVAIFDEGHYLSSPAAKRTIVAYGDTISLLPEATGVTHKARHTWVLTGTPQRNYPNELYSHFRALAPDRILGPRSGRIWSYEQFQQHYCEVRPAFVGLKITGSKNEDQLRAKLDGFMLRRLKRDVLPELPDVRFSEFAVKADTTDVELGIDPEEEKRLRKALAENGVDGLKALTPYLATLRRLTALAKVKPVCEYLKFFLADTDRKLVVFAYHTDVIRAIHAQLQKFAEGQTVWIHGERKHSDREIAVRRFQTEPKIRVFLGQIQAAGTGITLTAASDLLFLETSWVPADNAQAAMRIHRIGQKSLCNVRYAVLPKSVDALVTRAVMRKSESIAKVLGEAE